MLREPCRLLQEILGSISAAGYIENALRVKKSWARAVLWHNRLWDISSQLRQEYTCNFKQMCEQNSPLALLYTWNCWEENVFHKNAPWCGNSVARWHCEVRSWSVLHDTNMKPIVCSQGRNTIVSRTLRKGTLAMIKAENIATRGICSATDVLPQ